jgi:hypothetical protein
LAFAVVFGIVGITGQLVSGRVEFMPLWMLSAALWKVSNRLNGTHAERWPDTNPLLEGIMGAIMAAVIVFVMVVVWWP